MSYPPSAWSRAALLGLAGVFTVTLWGSGACGDATGTQIPVPGNAEVQVRLIVAQDADSAFAAVDVWISRVYLKPDDDTDNPLTSTRVDLFNDPGNPQQFDLLSPQVALSVDLTGFRIVSAGTYPQLRIMVDSARVTLAPGFRFQDGSSIASVALPTASTVGVEVVLDAPLSIVKDQGHVITADFDVNESFVILGRDNPGGFEGIDYEPLILELGRVIVPG